MPTNDRIVCTTSTTPTGGAQNLQLKHAITARTPFGADAPDERLRRAFDDLQHASDEVEIDTDSLPPTTVDVEPRVLGCTLDELFGEHLDYLNHEACYVVDASFEVTAYRTHWLGLQYDCDTVTDDPTVGHGALRTVRWYDGEPVGDGYAQGQFAALKAVVGDMVDRGVFDREEAVQYMLGNLQEWTGHHQSLLVHTSPE
ncbi:DUF6735 family protein [Haloarculaceae archaeon H-GB2-1]|nr:hypothetical protein [Haloarculaceae archaeon H-GB1-1]MEA5409609.1 DUF6735 family protein [Haloarculaceae archaeon H-GB2-1]